MIVGTIARAVDERLGQPSPAVERGDALDDVGAGRREHDDERHALGAGRVGGHLDHRRVVDDSGTPRNPDAVSPPSSTHTTGRSPSIAGLDRRRDVRGDRRRCVPDAERRAAGERPSPADASDGGHGVLVACGAATAGGRRRREQRGEQHVRQVVAHLVGEDPAERGGDDPGDADDAAARRSALPFLRLRHVPITAVGMITAADVPLATTGGIPNSRIIAGTMTMPPPTPSSPARMPVAQPDDEQGGDGDRRDRPRPSASVETNRRTAETMRIAGEQQPERAVGEDVEQLGADDGAGDGAGASTPGDAQSTLSWVA